MEKTATVLGIVASVFVIFGVLFYVGTHVDCAKVPLLGSGCVFSK